MKNSTLPAKKALRPKQFELWFFFFCATNELNSMYNCFQFPIFWFVDSSSLNQRICNTIFNLFKNPWLQRVGISISLHWAVQRNVKGNRSQNRLQAALCVKNLSRCLVNALFINLRHIFQNHKLAQSLWRASLPIQGYFKSSLQTIFLRCTGLG